VIERIVKFKGIFLCLLAILTVWGFNMEVKAACSSCVDLARTDEVVERTDIISDLAVGQTGQVALDNGLTVLMRHMPGSGLVCLMAIVDAGSTTEGKYIGSGISHFVEHMFFKGTPTRGMGVIPAQIKSYGGRMGGWTSFDYTGYDIVVLKEYFAQAAKVLADAIQNPLFDAAELEKERNVILREINLNEDSPDRKISRLLFSTAYDRHFYKHPIIGYKEVFEKLTRDNLVDYHKQMYTPGNIVLAITGDFDIQTVLPLIKSAFGSWSGSVHPEPERPREPVQLSTRVLTQPADVETCYLEMAFHGPALKANALFAMDMLSHILGHDRESRLYKILVEKYQLASSVSCWSYTPRDKGLFGVNVRFTDPGDTDRITEIVLSEIDLIIKKGVSRGEMARIRRQILNDYIWGLETSSSQARDIATSYLLTGDYDFSKKYVEGINKTSRKNIARAAGRYLKTQNMTKVALMPRDKCTEVLKAESTKIEPAQEKKSVYKGNEKTVVSAVAAETIKEEEKHTKIIVPREEEQNKKQRVKTNAVVLNAKKNDKKENNLRQDAGRIERVELPGGVVLLLKQDKRLPRCSVNAVFVGGLSVENDENNGISSLMASMLSRGTKKRDRAKIIRHISELAGNLSFYSGNNSLGGRMDILSSDLNKGLELLSDLTFNPIFPLSEIDKEKELILAGIKRADDDNFSVCHRALKQIMFKDHAFKMPASGTEESVGSITREQLMDFHSRIFVPENLTISVFGDFDRIRVLKQIKKYFSKGSVLTAKNNRDKREKSVASQTGTIVAVKTDNPILKNILKSAGTGFFSTNDPDHKIPREIIKPMNRQQVILMLGFPHYDIYSPDRFAFSLVDKSIKGHSSRLFKHIREKLGLAYMVGGFEVLGLNKGYYVIYAAVAPEAVEQAKKEIIKQVNVIRAEGLTDEEIISGRNKILGEMRMGRESISAEAFSAVLDECYGLGYDFYQKFEKQILNVDHKQIKEILQKYLDPADCRLAIAGPEENLKKY